MARLKIATYNINGIRARLGALLEWLEREQPDIACLQELKAPDEAFPQSDIERLGYGALWHGQKSWNGVAILARGAQPDERQRGLPDDPDGTQSRYLEADVHGLRVACLYLPNGNPWPGPKFEYKLAWFGELQRRAKALLKQRVPTVMCGDFNVVPTDELDIYSPASWRKDALLQPESRGAWFELLAQGWTDSIRSVHGDARIYTFWDYFRKHWDRDAGLRIDHLLLSPELAPMLKDAGVDRWVRGQPGASDHAPTWVLLDADGAALPAAKRASKRAGAAGVAAQVATSKPSASTTGGKRAPAKQAGSSRGASTGRASPAERAARGTSASTTAKTATRKVASKKVASTNVASKKAVSKKAVSKKAVSKKAVSKMVTPKKSPAARSAAATRPAARARAGKARG